MPFIINGHRRGGRLLAAAAGALALMLAPSAAQATITNPDGCTPQATLSQPFANWGDYGLYTPVSNAGLEDGSTGWTLNRGADVVGGNEPWNVGGADDQSSLDLPEGSSAVTAPICIDKTYPYFRFFARSAGPAKTSLKIEVLFLDQKGNVVATAPYNYATTSRSWQPTGLVRINVFDPKSTVSAAPVSFRFTPMGPGAHFQIDDVYVDPWARN